MLYRKEEMLTVVLGFIALRSVLLGVLLFLVTFTISLAIVSFILVRIPPDYFHKDRPRDLWADRHPAVRFLGVLAKNILGVVLVVLGILMSLPGVPGQGILTILMGGMLIDFPGKHRAELWLVTRKSVFAGVNKLRAKLGRSPLLAERPEANGPA